MAEKPKEGAQSPAEIAKGSVCPLMSGIAVGPHGAGPGLVGCMGELCKLWVASKVALPGQVAMGDCGIVKILKKILGD